MKQKVKDAQHVLSDMHHNGINFEKLSFLVDHLDDPIFGIPEEGGIYYWVYFPDFDPKTATPGSIKNLVTEFMEKELLFEERIKGVYKFEGTIREQGYPRNGEMFGLNSSSSSQLFNYLAEESNRYFFHTFFKELCFARPFYVGKANNLRSRLNQHFKGRSSHIIFEINKNLISSNNIWIGYKLIPDTAGNNINRIFEEIFSRKIKPGLTKKPN